MIPTYCTFLFSLTSWQFLFRQTRDILAINLPLMAIITEMGVTPTKPLSYWTTESAFEGDELFSVFCAVCCLLRATWWTDQLLWIKFLSLLWISHSLGTALPTPKVRLMTLITLKVSVNSHRIFLFVFEVMRTWIFQFLVIVSFLMHQPLQSFLFYFAVKSFEALNYPIKRTFLRKL